MEIPEDNSHTTKRKSGQSGKCANGQALI